jgi:hypothetical protein
MGNVGLYHWAYLFVPILAYFSGRQFFWIEAKRLRKRLILIWSGLPLAFYGVLGLIAVFYDGLNWGFAFWLIGLLMIGPLMLLWLIFGLLSQMGPLEKIDHP